MSSGPHRRRASLCPGGRRRRSRAYASQAQRAEIRPLFLRTCGSDHLGAEPARDLDCGESDAARCGMDEHTLAGAKPRCFGESVISREEHEIRCICECVIAELAMSE